MRLPRVVVGLLAGGLGASLAAQTPVGIIRTQPLPSPQDIANLEARVLQNPEDVDARASLLQLYLEAAPPPGAVDTGRRSVRLQHILYLVEHHPEAPVSGSHVLYVYREHGPYADVSDHEAVRAQWLAAVQSHPGSTAVTMNAVRFLEMEDRGDAEQVLQRAIGANPENREIAADLGFLYAKEFLGSPLAAHAKSELELSSNPIVLAAAATALPNLAKGYDSILGAAIEFADGLAARARQLAPGDADIQGPMPFIKYFIAAGEGLRVANVPAPSGPPTSTAEMRIRVGENVQAANLIRRVQPEYPEAARAAGIAGDVQFSIIIGRDGTVQNVQLVSGHPLLVEPAVEAVRNWVYRPTLLNGSPVEVATTVTVSFPPN